MSKFVLTAQLQLKAPGNARQVVQQMQRQLSGVSINVSLKNGSQTQRQLANTNKQVQQLNSSGQRLGKTFGLAVNRFAAFTVATRAVSLLTNSLANATKEAIEFERELVKISQVTGKTLSQLSKLSDNITDLSIKFGTSSKALLSTGRILAQAGIQANDLTVALTTLAKTTLAPTFEDITKTAEGAVAILAQFGKGVGALEQQLGAINAVAGQFAVESGDLISVVRRTGGVFKAAGGELEELIALFTSVRATTRESAESIATGLRTIFTRIQRPKTIEFLKQFGVELTDLNGKFVGPYEAIRQLSEALSGLGEGDIRFVQIAEELGGFRQIGKVIPLLQQFETAELARQAALEGGNSLNKDAATAQQALAVQITKVKEEFLALVRSISQTGSFQTLVKTTLDLASALIKVADALKPIIPLITAFAGFKLAGGLIGFGRGFGAALKGGAGGVRGFNSGGLVPGTGNRDTVPAMLTPGEFVIRKSSVSKLGAGTLAAMNGNKYAGGGVVSFPSSKQYVSYKKETYNKSAGADFQKTPSGNRSATRFNENDQIQYNLTRENVNLARQLQKDTPATREYKAAASSLNDKARGLAFEKVLLEAGRVTELAGSPTSRIDARKGNKLIEIKSTREAIAESNISDKMIGAALNPRSEIDRKVTGLKDKALNEKNNTINLGNITVLQDTTSTKVTKKQEEGLKARGLAVSGGRFRVGQSRFFGGAIQKFALGGLAQKNRVGFAILDPDRKAQDVDAKVTRAQVRGAVKGTEGQRKALDKELSWPNKNFKVARQGLNEKTSKKFYDTLTKEAAQGVSVAATGLSSDLGLGNITVPETSKQLIADSIRKSGSMMGKVFEDVVNVMDGKGKFAPAPPGAPFDFKGGLQGALKDNYNNLPSSFVDAKTSYTEASVGEAQKKIINELAQTYQQTPTYANSKKGDKKSETDKQAAARIAREQKGQARLAKLRAKAGFNMGGPAPSDTVPALLTPGEFVISKKAASSIGKANLDRMNKKGVAGFATGGPVGKVKKFALGSGVKSTSPSPVPRLDFIDRWNKKGEEAFNRFFAMIDRKTPTLQSAFGKVSDTIKKVIIPLDKSAKDTQKISSKLSVASGAAGTSVQPASRSGISPANINFKGVHTLDDAAKRLADTLKKMNVPADKQKTLTETFVKQLQKTTSYGEALNNTFKNTEISVKRLSDASIKAAKADEMEAAASTRAANKMPGSPMGGGPGNKEGGGMGAMGIFFAISALTSLIPQVEGATGGFEAMQNEIGPLVMSLSAFGFLVSALPAKMQGLAGGMVAAVGAGYAFAKMIDAYTGVHLRAKEAIEKGLIKESGTAAGESKRQTTSNTLTVVLAVVAAAVAAIIALIAGVAVAIPAAIAGVVGGLIGLTTKLDFFDGIMSGLSDKMSELLGSDTIKMAKERAEAEAAVIKAQNEAAENAKKVSELFKEVEAGDISLRDAIKRPEFTADIENRKVAVAEQRDLLREVGTTSGGFGFGGQEKLTQRVVEETRKLIEVQKALREAQLKNLPTLIKLGREQFIAGKSLSDFKKTAEDVFGQPFDALDPEVQAKALRAYYNNAQAIAENTAAFAASTMGLRFINAAAQGLNATLDRTSSVLNGKFNSLSSSIDIVSAGLSGGDIDTSLFNRSLNEVNASLKSFGVSQKQLDKMNTAFSAVRNATAGFDEALKKTRDEALKKGLSTKDIKDELIKNLTAGLNADEAQIIQALFGNIDLSESDVADLQAGNFESILSKLDEAGKKAFEESQAAGKALAQAQDKLLSITKQRADAEKKLIDAQRKSLTLQEEGAEIIAKANGKQLTSQEKFSFEDRRLSASLGGGTGSDGSYSGRMSRIGQIRAGSIGATSRIAGVAGGGEGDTFQVANDQQYLQDASRQLDALAENARKRNKLYEEELKIVQKKNALEKSSLEKLISGDITGFVEEQSAAAAQVALRSGNQSLANMFSSQSLGKAYSNLEEQGLSDSEKRAAATVALGPGFASERNIGVLSGTTDEEKRIRAGMEQEGQVLQALGPAVEDVGGSDFKIASAALKDATDQYVDAQNRAAAASQKFAQTMEEAEKEAERQQQAAKRAEQARAEAEAAEKEAAKRREDEKKIMQTDVARMDITSRGSIQIYDEGDKEKDRPPTEVINNPIYQTPDSSYNARGGMIYASRGIFVPRGTDTVPAMLTPGEFVVNRAAVRRGNNLQVLQAMNSGNGVQSNSTVAHMSKGGTVYRRRGSKQPESGGLDMTAMFKNFESSARMFSDAVNRLVGFKLNIQLDPTNVNVNLTGASFLEDMKDKVKNEILEIVSERIRGAKTDFTGDINIDPFTQRLV
jgi:TP901 family phage tail tape measure protein